MSNETRINLLHLLEDIRDGYSSPLEEVIITELVANALDSGATIIQFNTDPAQKTLQCIDNGAGMRRPELKEYHNIASSEKTRGAGIGFAGIGAKLSLLVAEKVITESKGARGSRSASEWKLSGAYRAPWKFLPYSGTISTPRGSSVTIHIKNENSNLVKDEKIIATITKHFFPLLHKEILDKMLKLVYRKGVEFYVNDKKLSLPDYETTGALDWFYIQLGSQKRPIGGGYFTLRESAPDWLNKIIGDKPSVSILAPGLTISTYGKIIKSGWEWTGITPKNGARLVGLVEIPAMSELLTTNKDNFLCDSTSLKKYYRFRKAIQEAILPILRKYGEADSKQSAEPQSIVKPLARQIEDTLNDLVEEFPELSSVVGVKHRLSTMSHGSEDKMVKEKNKETEIERININSNDPKSPKNSKESKKRKNLHIDDEGVIKKQTKKPGLRIILEPINDDTSTPLLGRLIEDTISINTSHPAWSEAVSHGWEGYHIAMSIALILFEFTGSDHNPQEFVSKFFSSLSKQMKPRTLV